MFPLWTCHPPDAVTQSAHQPVICSKAMRNQPICTALRMSSDTLVTNSAVEAIQIPPGLVNTCNFYCCAMTSRHPMAPPRRSTSKKHPSPQGTCHPSTKDRDEMLVKEKTESFTPINDQPSQDSPLLMYSHG